MSNSLLDGPLNERELRKAWLKRCFASFEYHEEMLRLHRQWLDVLRRALARAERDDSDLTPGSPFKSVKQWAAHFRRRTLPLIERNDDLGKYSKAEWSRYRATATFRSIPDYDRYLISEGDALGWMTASDQTELAKYWGLMDRMAQNIQYTVDDYWFNPRKGNDDMLLDEKYTGPISWPANWREDLLGANGSSLAAMPAIRTKAGDAVPQSGLWEALDPSAHQQRVSAGDSLPNLASAYGITVWQRVGD